MSAFEAVYHDIERDIWTWIHEFITVPNEFYHFKFAPCPFARQAVQSKSVDVQVWQSGEIREFIKQRAFAMRESPRLTTRVMVFPPQTRFAWGIDDYVELLNVELVPTNVFLNPGVAKTTHSRYPGSTSSDPYFIVIANSLDAVLAGADSLAKTDFYRDWPAAHYAHVVERRERMAKQYAKDST